MSYHRLNNLAELLKGDLAAEIRRVIFSKDLMDIKCTKHVSTKVNVDINV